MDNIDKFTEPTYQNYHNILGTPFDIGFGVGRASGSDNYGCAHNQYSFYYGAGITSTTIGQGVGLGQGESMDKSIVINHEEIF